MKVLTWITLAFAAALLAAFLLVPPQDSTPVTTAGIGDIPQTEHKLDLDITEDAPAIQIWTINLTPGCRFYKKDAYQ